MERSASFKSVFSRSAFSVSVVCGLLFESPIEMDLIFYNMDSCHSCFSVATILVKTNEKFEPPSPHFNDEKRAHFGLSVNSSLIWGEGGFISHFILSKIVGFVLIRRAHLGFPLRNDKQQLLHNPAQVMYGRMAETTSYERSAALQSGLY